MQPPLFCCEQPPTARWAVTTAARICEIGGWAVANIQGRECDCMLLKILLILHWVGLALVGVGLYLWFFSGAKAGDVNQMVWTATALGLGGLLMSPWPVMKAFDWMSRK